MSNLIPISLCERALEIKDEEISKLKAELTDCKAECDRLKAIIQRITEEKKDL